MRLNTLPIALLAAATTAAPQAYSKRQEDKQPCDEVLLKALAGSYSLVNTSSTLNGESIPDAPYGEHPVGMLIYTATGFMSATITATEPELRPNLTFPFQETDLDSDWALVGKHGIGYAGPLQISTDIPASETEGQVFHGPLTVANVPTWVGQKQRRNYTIIEQEEDGKLATYLKIGSERGGGYRGTLWWKKLA